MAEVEDAYLLLDLDPAVLDWAKIEQRILEKQREWSALGDRAGERGRQASANLKRIKDLRDALQDPVRRQQLATTAERTIKERRREAERHVNDALRVVIELLKKTDAGGAVFSDATLLETAKVLNNALTTTQIEAEFTKAGLKRETATTTPKAGDRRLIPALDKIIGDQLKFLGMDSLYAFLERDPETSAEDLCKRADDLSAALKRQSKIDAAASAKQELVGHCKAVFRDAGEKEKYDNSLTARRMETLRPIIEHVGRDGVISAVEYTTLIDEAGGRGVPEQLAFQYLIDEFVIPRGWRIIPADRRAADGAKANGPAPAGASPGTGAAQAASPHPTIRFLGREFRSPEELAAAFAANPGDAGQFWQTRGTALQDWLKHDLGRSDIADQLARVDRKLDPEVQLFGLITALDPKAPPMFAGMELSRDAIRGLADSALAVAAAGATLVKLYRDRILELGGRLPGREYLGQISRSLDSAVAEYEKLRLDVERDSASTVKPPALDGHQLVILLAAAVPGSGVGRALLAEAQKAATADARRFGWFVSLEATIATSMPASLLLRSIAGYAERLGRAEREAAAEQQYVRACDEYGKLAGGAVGAAAGLAVGALVGAIPEWIIAALSVDAGRFLYAVGMSVCAIVGAVRGVARGPTLVASSDRKIETVKVKSGIFAACAGGAALVTVLAVVGTIASNSGPAIRTTPVAGPIIHPPPPPPHPQPTEADRVKKMWTGVKIARDVGSDNQLVSVSSSFEEPVNSVVFQISYENARVGSDTIRLKFLHGSTELRSCTPFKLDRSSGSYWCRFKDIGLSSGNYAFDAYINDIYIGEFPFTVTALQRPPPPPPEPSRTTEVERVKKLWTGAKIAGDMGFNNQLVAVSSSFSAPLNTVVFYISYDSARSGSDTIRVKLVRGSNELSSCKPYTFENPSGFYWCRFKDMSMYSGSYAFEAYINDIFIQSFPFSVK